MWFCRHIIPSLGIFLTFGLGYFNRKFFLTSTQKQLLKQAMTEAPDMLRHIFANAEGNQLNNLKILCAVKPLLTPEEIKQLPNCSKNLIQTYPGIKEICGTLEKPCGKYIMEFLNLPIHGQVDYVNRLNQLEAALAAYGWVKLDPKLKRQSLIKEFRALIS